MKQALSGTDTVWLDNTYQKLCEKLSAQCDRIGDMIPYVPVNGRYPEDKGKTDVTGWINGFWGGMLWQMYHATGEAKYRQAAEDIEVKLDRAFDVFQGLHHDVGFMWLPTAVADYRLTGNERSKTRGLHAANLLLGRFNHKGGFIRAWDPHIREGKLEECTGWIIIDCMLNINLLYWASKETGDPRFADAAITHADTARKNLVREDGSCNHIAVLDPDNGALLATPFGQGYASGSSWSRGQSWGLYGFALSARHTNDKVYLDTAKKIAHYFLACAGETGYIPLSDFRAPKEPVKFDTTAGNCAACGLLELAQQVPELERELYLRGAVKLLQAIEAKYANWNPDEDGLIGGGSGSYFGKGDENTSIIYGDYFFTEAILRLMGKDFLIW